MHPNPAFRGASEDEAIAFAAARGFGLLTLAGEGPLASHLPFVLEGRRLSAHIVRSNPIWRRLREGPATALLAVSGPDSYISPDWYGEGNQVPTWNYVAVHLRGEVALSPEAALRPHLEALTAAFEARLAPKAPWRLEKTEAEALDRMMRMIAPIEMRVETVDSTFKLNQNKSDAARLGAADAVEAGGLGAETAALAAMMRAAG